MQQNWKDIVFILHIPLPCQNVMSTEKQVTDVYCRSEWKCIGVHVFGTIFNNGLGVVYLRQDR